MSVRSARRFLLSASTATLIRIGNAPIRRHARLMRRALLGLGTAGLLTALGTQGLQTAAANGDTRTLTLHHLHTGEDITITFKREGRYDSNALNKLNWFLRDWRNDKTTEMDPHLFDLVWEAYRAVDARLPIQIVSAYRSPETNSMLRRRSSGVAKASQHTHGHAMDFFIPGVPLEQLRNVGLRLQRGGVGFYPTSGSPFVHLDTGSVRHWPRLTHDQLVKIFPDGRTVHVGTDGRPLKNYALALADIERRGGHASAVSLAAAGMSGSDAAEMDNDGRTTARGGGNLLARLFGGGKDKSEPAPRAPTIATAARPAPMPNAVTTTRIATAEPPATVPLPQARPVLLASATPAPETTPAPEATLTPPMPRPAPARLARLETREPAAAGRHPLADGAFQTASADPAVTASIAADQRFLSAMAYAPTDTPVNERASAVPNTLAIPSRPAAPAAAMPGELRAAIAAQRFQEPWLRAVMLAPSVAGALTAVPMGPVDGRQLAPAMQKPRLSVAVTFSADPHAGLRADRFTGEAVVFLATVNFGSRRTAALMAR